ncbi:MAG: beta-lactamase family protein [Gammaproteobacteria bacterium]|nr:beta-lactamase family protein [Gammaproteobacteria bacterium]
MNRRFLVAMCVLVFWAMPTSAAVDINGENVKQWADETFTQALNEHRLSGAILTVVRDGEIIFNTGYGYADYSNKTPIDPERTQFRIGSNTKTFTATAIAQLMEQGLIDSIDDSVNRYLKRDQLPSYEGQDITLRHLLTHSAGFASRTFGIGTVNEHELPLSAAEVQSRQLKIVRKPGGRSVYSNYATTMLAIVVEDITGVKIAEYFEQEIFAPLDMSHAVLNMSAQATEYLAQPYAFFPNGDVQAISHVGIHPFFGPVGSINASGTDMGLFMIAQLDAGKSGPSPLGVSPQGFARLHNRMHGNHPDINGFGMIFATGEWAGEKGFGHGGDWEGFHSWMWMWPDSNTGVFFSILSESPTVVGTLEGIMGSERLTPNEMNPVLPPMENIGTFIYFLESFLGPDTPPVDEGRIPLDELEGAYRVELRPYGTVMEFIEVLAGGTVIEVARVGQDGLMIGGKGPYRQTAEGVFWSDLVTTSIDNSFIDTNLWTFSWDEGDELYYLAPRLGITPLVKVGNYENPGFYAQLFGIGLLVLLTGLVMLFWRVDSLPRRIVKYAAVLTPVFVILIPIVLMFGYPEGDTPPAYLARGDSGRFVLSIVFANLAALGCVSLIIGFVQCWVSSGGLGIIRRIHLSLLGLAAMAMLMVLHFTNYIGVNLP